ncbi:hypothetical protein GBA65_03270 [Rubrobacter marinus]|uniref:Oligosaccharide repeat unit polymerase n=1 Tax=Rubrobacter marinus TaxID=2653852 RepID=A0A6G8PTN5_9ACTN|nr:hypothetical protein [Rubrobacter marinus]QIN77693.1 hypothetical protein GBA65_03270 [Rubrobacter marinus]
MKAVRGSGVVRLLARVPRALLAGVLAPLVLLVLPAVLWLSVPDPGTLGVTPAWLNVPDPARFDADPFYLASLVLLGFLAIVMIAAEASLAPFSLHLVHWVFVYVFFFAAPLAQYKMGTFPWEELFSFETDRLVLTNLAVLLWSVAWIAARVSQFALLRHRPVPLGPRVSALGVWICAGLALFSAAYLLLTLGPMALISRGATDISAGNAFSASSSALVVDKLLRAFPAAAVAGAVWFASRGNAHFLVRAGLLIATLGLLLVADFPSGSPRHLVGSIYLGLVLIFLNRYLRTGWPFVFLMVGGMLVAFPIMSALYLSTGPHETVPYLRDGSFLGAGMTTGDFDAYSMVGYTIGYLHDGPGSTFGHQLLGVLLFFVPRSIWPDKPFGSGYTVAVDQGLLFNNVSSSPIAEGLINFGWAGVVLFAVALCWIFGLLDSSFRHAERSGEGTLLRLLYPFLIGFAFFLMRGDLLSSFAFVAGFVAAFLPLAVRLPRVALRTKKSSM